MQKQETTARRILKPDSKEYLFDLLFVALGIGLILYIVIRDRFMMGMDGDVAPLTYSLYSHSIFSLMNGELPLWNTTVWMGFPAYCHPMTEALYPVNWLLCFLFYNSGEGFVSYNLMTGNYVFHLLLYLISVYALCRRLRVSREASAFAALTAVISMSFLNSYSFTWNVSFSMICYCPLLLYWCVGVIDAGDAKASRKNAIWLGITIGILALMSLSGLFFVNVFFVVLICLFKLAEMIIAKDFRDLKRYCLHMALAALISLFIALPAIIGELELLPASARYLPERGFVFGLDSTQLSYSEFIGGGSFGLHELSNIFFGNAKGTITIMLAGFVFFIFGIGNGERRYVKYFFLFAAVFCVLESITFFFPQIVYHIPLLNTIREPMLYSFYFPLFASILTAKGLDSFIEYAEGREKKRTSGIVWFIVFAVLIVNLIGQNIQSKKVIAEAAALLAMLAVIILFRKKIKSIFVRRAIIMAVLTVSVTTEFIMLNTNETRGKSYSLTEAAEIIDEHMANNKKELAKLELDDGERILSWMSSPLPANMGSVLQYNDVSGYFNLIVDKAVKYYSYSSVSLRNSCITRNLKYIFHARNQDEETTKVFDASFPQLEKVAELSLYTTYTTGEKETVTVYTTNDSKGSAWLVSNVRYYDETTTDEEIYSLINEVDLADTACILHPEIGPLDELTGKESVKRIRRTDNTMVYEVETEGRHLLVNAEMMYPGWNVYVDGKRETLMEANYLDRAVVVEKGKHIVEFRYEPRGIQIFLWGAAAGLVLLISITIIRKCRKNRGEQKE